jgi:CRISPR-associated protein Cmr2
MGNNKTFEALQGIKIEKKDNLNEYVAFCKYTFKPKNYGKVLQYNLNREELIKDFPFLKDNFDENFLKKGQVKNLDTTKDFPLAFLKEKILKKESDKEDNKKFSFDISQIQNISGIITNKNNIKNLVKKLPKYSFTVCVNFKLLEPYFSKDDDEFYIIQNPILKEHVFKVPMVRGSSWKGALAGAFRKLFNEKDNNTKINTKIIESYLRIFGAGSESIKEIESYLKEKSKNLEDFKNNILEFILFELGMKITKKDIDGFEKDTGNGKNEQSNVIDFLSKKIIEKFKKYQSNLPTDFQTHKGRAIFYPTYFDKISLEIINPHDRRKRAGTVPIHYEVVPKDTEGILQIVYIPFDGVLKEDKDLKEEVEQDLKWLCKAIKNLANEGIGAKTKLGWGRFEMFEGIYCINS